MKINLQERFGEWFGWAVRTFGEASATSRSERALRVAEEAVELAQAEGVPREVMDKLLDRCYSRPVGEPAQEAGQILVTLGVYCELTGTNVVAEADRDYERVLAKLRDDPDYFKKRIAAKVAAGIEMSAA